jgi:hypothetical protein
VRADRDGDDHARRLEPAHGKDRRVHRRPCRQSVVDEDHHAPFNRHEAATVAIGLLAPLELELFGARDSFYGCWATLGTTRQRPGRGHGRRR